MEKIDFVIIGAGVVGMQTALTLINNGVAPEDIAIFEQNPFPGEHSSSRNSGVLHAGLYYPQNSLKQKLCLDGNRMWRTQAFELGIEIKKIGKYVVATNIQEIEELNELYNFSIKKSVPEISWVGTEEIDCLKEVINVEKAFLSKNTGIIDCAEMIKKLSEYLYKKGVNFLENQKVDLIYENKKLKIKCNKETFRANTVINTAGLYAVDLRKSIGLEDIENNYVKGNYLKLNKKYFNDYLIYPLPEKSLKGLGIHTVVQGDGSVLFGPNTEDVFDVNYQMNSKIIAEIYYGISKIFKNINIEDLSLAYSGIRSKIIKDNKLYSDFLIQSPVENYIEALGIDSPGLTASPAIASYICSIAMRSST